MSKSEVPIWRRPRARLYAIVVLLWLGIFAILVLASRILLPFILAALAAYVINPVIAAVSRRRIGGWLVPRWAAVLAVYAVIAALLWLFSVSVIPQIYREAVRGLTELRDFVKGLTPERIESWSRDIDAFLRQYGIPVEVVPSGEDSGRVTVDLAGAFADAIQNLSTTVQQHLSDVVGLSRSLLLGTVQSIFFVVLLLMITAFISVDAPRILTYSESLVPRAWRGDWRAMVWGIDAGLSGVVRGQITIMAINGTLTLIGLLVLRVPFPFALAALATVLYVVPIFGTILSSIPIVLLALTQGLSRGLFALGWILGIHALESYVLNPKIMGDASKIHPVLIVLVLVIGEYYAGIVGALLAVPVAAVVFSVFKFLHRKAEEIDAELTRSSAPPAQPPVT
jgi:predicted PurR-regulated permease PerM